MTPQEQAMMARFRQDYLDLLPGRVASIGDLVRRGAVEPAQVALLTLESSSAMVGAGVLAGAVRQLRTALGGASVDELARLIDRMVEEAGEVAVRLAERPS